MAPASSSSVGRCRRVGPVLDDPEGGVDTGLGFAGPGLGPAPQPGQLVAGQVAPGGLGRRGLHLALGLGLQVRRVPALVDEGAAPVDLQHPGGHPVEEMAVVGDQDQAAVEGAQPLFEPGHRAQVEVVGGLVEDQQLGRVGQDPGQRHPLGLAPRQGRPRRRRPTRPCPVGRGRLPPPSPGPTAGPPSRGKAGHLLEEADPRTPPPPHLTLVGTVDARPRCSAGSICRCR